MVSSLITEHVQKHRAQEGHRVLSSHQSSTMSVGWSGVECEVMESDKVNQTELRPQGP